METSGLNATSHPAMLVLGISHRTAPVALRDRVLFRDAQLDAFAEEILESGALRETVILSTCNRSEIYGIAAPGTDARTFLEEAWARHRGVEGEVLRSHDYFLQDQEAVRHLYRVIGSLDSLVLGEMQILGQVKDAYQLAMERQWADFHLNRIFQTGLHAGKRIHAETSIHAGAVSISYAAVELARKVLGDLQDKTVGLIGAGEMGELAARHLHRAGVRKFLVFNRSAEPARRMAEAFGGTACGLDALPTRMAECDIVLSATGAADIVVTEAHVREAMRRRHGNPLFLIDIAAPADIDPGAGSVDNTFLFNIDDLRNAVQDNVEQRREAARRALEIAEEEAERIAAWTRSLEVVPTLKRLRERHEEMAAREIEKFAAGLDAEARERLEALGRGLMNKFLHVPTTRLKRLGEQGQAERASYYTAELFGLNEEDEKA